MFYFLGVIVGLFIAMIFLFGDEFVRAAQLYQDYSRRDSFKIYG